MIAVYSVALASGVVVFGWWIVAERHRGNTSAAANIRRGISALMAFGLGGFSASYAGLNAAVSVVLAIGAGAAMVVYSDRASADADR